MKGLTEARLDSQIFCCKFADGRTSLIGQRLDVLRSKAFERTLSAFGSQGRTTDVTEVILNSRVSGSNILVSKNAKLIG